MDRIEASRQREERKTVVTLSAISALRGVWFSMQNVVWQPFVLSLGISMKSLGGLESVMDLTRISIQPVIGMASDAHGRKRFILARDLLILAAVLLLVSAQSWHLLFIGVILVGTSQALFPIWNTVIAESSGKAELGYTYSVIGTVRMAVGLLATLAAGYIGSVYGFRAVFMIASVFVIASFLMVWARIRETLARRSDSGVSLIQLAGALLNSLRPPRYLWGWYIAMSVDLLAFNIGYRLLNGMLTKGYGYTPYMLGVISMVLTAAMAFSQIPLGRMVDRIGYVRFLAISQILACVVLGMVVLSKSFMVVLAAQALMGVAGAFWGPAEQAWIAINVDPKKRAQAISSFSTFRGLLSLPGPFIGGVLFDAYGFDIPILLNLALAVVDIVLILILVKDRVLPEKEVEV